MGLVASSELYERLEQMLHDVTGTMTLQNRFRALFELKNLGDNRAVEIIASCFSTPSALLRHELAYVLGQMRNPHALDKLIRVLEDTGEDPMVRHEAGEALGAIGSVGAVGVLQKYRNDPLPVISETCELALERISRLHDRSSPDHSVLASGPQNEAYSSVDPAPPETSIRSVLGLEKRLLDPHLCLFDRYKAMFGLRNISTQEAVLALTRGLLDSSALFRHEIAYVLGQLQHPASISALASALETDDMDMVRHECAEALGAIATPEAMEILQRFVNDKSQVVRESCIVALDIGEHENSSDLHYSVSVKQLKEMPFIGDSL